MHCDKYNSTKSQKSDYVFEEGLHQKTLKKI